MKKLKLSKVIASSLILASVLTLNPIAASAEWKHDSNGWWNSEGSSWSVGWKEIDGKWYYFNSDGYMLHDTTIDGYKMGSDGAWIQSIQNNSLNSEQDIRESAFNQLNAQAKKIIKGTWQDSTFSQITLKEGMGDIDDKSYIGKDVYIVHFPIESNSTANEISVYIGIDNHKLIGYGYLD